MNSESFFQILLNQFSLNEYKLMLSMMIVNSVPNMMILGIPLFYQLPILKCFNDKNEFFECNITDACQSGRYQIVDLSPKSLSTEFSLVCSEESQRIFSLSLVLSGCMLGTIINILIYVPYEKYQFYVGMGGITFASFGFLTLVFSNSLLTISLFLSLCAATMVPLFTWISAYNNLIFPKRKAVVAIVTTNIGFAIYGAFLVALALFTHSSWKITIFISCFLGIMASFYMLFQEIPPQNNKDNILLAKENESDNTKKENNWTILKIGFQNQRIRSNHIIFAIYLAAITFAYNGVPLEIESVKGSLYINLFSLTLLEIITLITSGYFGMRYDVLTANRKFCLIVTLLLTCFCLINYYFESWTYITFINFILLLFISISYNMSNSFMYMIMYRITPANYLPVFLSTSRLVIRGIGVPLLPFINHFVKNSLGLHPFSFIALLYFLSCIALESADYWENFEEKPGKECGIEMNLNPQNNKG